MAKQIIRLINDVAEKFNKDVEIEDRLRVLFVTNYGVSSSEKIIAASEVSEHISTAGTEASGTSNMKFFSERLHPAGEPRWCNNRNWRGSWIGEYFYLWIEGE